MAGPGPITLVLVGTLRARISSVGVSCHMVRLTGPTAITGVCIVTLTRATAATGCACQLEAVVMTCPIPITLVLVGTLRARIPAVGARRHMFTLSPYTALSRSRAIALV